MGSQGQCSGKFFAFRVHRLASQPFTKPRTRKQNMKPPRKQIGLAIVGCGTIGRIRAEFARDYPGIGWLGLCDANAEVGQKLAEDAKADFFTTDFNELLKRPEVTAAIIATDENAHVAPVLAACERKLDL